MLACAAWPRARANARRAAPGRGSRAAALLTREKRLPADRARRPTGARPVDLIAHPPDGRRIRKKPGFPRAFACGAVDYCRSEEHTSELQSLMRISYAVFCLKNKKQ